MHHGLVQIPAGKILHGDENGVPILLNFTVDRDNVRVMDGPQLGHSTAEALKTAGVLAKVAVQNFECDQSPGCAVKTLPNSGVPALANHVLKPVALPKKITFLTLGALALSPFKLNNPCVQLCGADAANPALFAQ